jgi:hypothetical protein
MVHNWIDIEDQPVMLDCEIDEELERITKNQTDDDDEDDSEEGRAEPQATLPKLGHQEAKAMIERLLSHSVQSNFPEDLNQGLRKFAKELDKQYLNQSRSQSTLKSFFRPKANQPPE